ncbi:uncharacterized protein LOC129724590 [Wyeomyia smithii]|uniref:uncharacterized protein LOC129724590 n=1 Tax=Wyeomyia smithii TaxID=174621 RepID=UPI0024680760|nr:uncharacterized protein LOC129724590 [Wyeomyia smithii]
MADNITVSIKVRPLIKREKDLKLTSQWRIRDNTIAHVDGSGEPFVFDHIFDESVRTKELFERVCRPIVHSTLNGINGTIFAYGQTSSGKTYTMMGDGDEELGVVPLTAREIFREIENNKDRQFLIRVGYIEIYNEKIYDLLDKSNANLKILESQFGDVQLNYKEVIINCPEQIMKHLEEGNKVKRIGDTNMNERSSRSHTIFRITIESSDIGRTEGDENDAVQISTLNLVDLAGSEKADQTGATGSRLKEGAHINKSLLSLSCVIQKLSENADNLKYINYRDSKLTRILQASLGGNAVTSMICNITPAALDESYYTLSFAMRAKTIKNKPIVNEVISETAMMKRLQREIKRLQDELKSEQSKNSKIKTLELQNAITMRTNQIINSQTHIQFDKARRRTWCPSSSGIPKPVGYVERDNRLMPPPPPFLSGQDSSYGNEKTSSISVRPELINHGISADLLARKVRSTTPTRQFLNTIERLDNSDEFVPAELVDFGERSPQSIARDIHTPCGFKSKRRSRRSSTGDSLVFDYEKRCKELEQELLELQEFTNLEKNLDLANIKNQLYTREELQDDLKNREERLESLEERCRDYEEELRQKREQIFDMEKELIVARKECEASMKEAELCRNLQNSIQVEYELFQQRSKNREKELIECLQEARESGSNGSAKMIGLVDSSELSLQNARTELKQLEVRNYELQLQLEKCHTEAEKLKKTVHDGADKIAKFKELLDKDVCRKDAKKLFRVMTKLRGILADEDLLINTSIDTDELVDSIGEISFNDSTGRSSPAKIVLVNEEGKTNVIYDNDNCQMLDVTIENGELKKKVKLLEEENKQVNTLLVKYESEIVKTAEKENLLKQITNQLEHERSRVSTLEQSSQEYKKELSKMTSEYNELSTQVLDYIQDIDNYKEQIEQMNNTLAENETILKTLRLEKEQFLQQISKVLEEKQKLEENMKEQENKYLSCKAEYDSITMAFDHQKIADDIEKQLQDQISDLEEKLEECKEKSQRVEKQLFDMQSEKNSLEDELSEQRRDYVIYSTQSQLELGEVKTELQEMLAKNQSLQKTVSDQETELTSLSARITRLSEQNTDLQMQLSNVANHLKGTENNSEANSEALPELQQTLGELNMVKLEKDSLLLQLETIQQSYQVLLEEKEKADDKCDTLCNELSQLVSEKENTNENDRLVLKNEINDLQQTKYELEQTAASMEQQISTLEARLSEAEQQKTKLMSRIQSLETEIEESSNIREHLDREVRALKIDLGNLDQQLQENNEKVEQYQKQNSDYEQELGVKTETIAHGIQEQLTLRKSIVQLKERLAQINENELIEKLKESEKQTQEQKRLLDSMKQEKMALQEQIIDLVADCELLKQQVAEKEALLEKTNTQVASLETNVTELASKLEQTEICSADVKQLKEELNTLEKQKQEIYQQLEQTVVEMNSLKGEANCKNEQLERVKLQIISLENEVAALKLKNEHIELAHIETGKVRDDLEQQLMLMRSSLEEKDKICSAQTIEIDDLKRIVSELENKLEHLQQQLSENLVHLEKQKDDSIQINLLHEKNTKLTEEFVKEKTQYRIDLDAKEEHSLKLQQYIKELEQVKLDLQSKLNTLAEEIQQLEATNTRQEAQIVNLNAEVIIREDKLKALNRDLAAKLTELENNKQEYNVKLIELDSQIQDSLQLNTQNDLQLKNLEREKEDLLSKLNQVVETEMRSMESTIKQLNEQKDDLQCKLERKSSELDQTAKLLGQEKKTNENLQQQLAEAKSNLSPDGRPSLGDSRVAQALRKENDDLLKQLHELQKTHVSKTNQLQERIDELKEEVSTMRHEASFQEKELQIGALEEKINHYEQVYEDTKNKHRSLQRQNDELRVKHQNLVMEMDDLRRLADKDRRSRRQSTHDDRRGVWFNTKDNSTMTDPSSSDCSCVEMDIQIKDLRRQLTIKECQLKTEKMMAAANPLKNDVVELRRLIKERESDIFKLQDEIRTLSVAIDRERQQLTKHCNNCVRQQRMQSLRSDKAVNTDRVENSSMNSPLGKNKSKQLEEIQEELRRLSSKYQDMKRLCRIRNEKIVSLSQDIQEKENESSIANKNVQQEVLLLKRQLKESEDKHTQMMKLLQSKHCVSKTEKIVQTDLSSNDDIEMLRNKYEKYKNMAIVLIEQNEELKRKMSTA